MLPVAKLLSKRVVLLVIASGVFLGALLVASQRLNGICENGSCYDLGVIRQKLTGNHSEQHGANDPNRLGPYRPTDLVCKDFPDTSNVLLVMKTGASEASSKVPNQLITNLKCISEFLVFSDMEQDIAGLTVHDSLDKVDPDIRLNSPDFDLYQRQKDCVVDVDSCNKHSNAAEQAWGLDKYKNVHIGEKTWRLRPGYDWYLYVDADTYVLWATLMEWLKRLDPSTEQYIGSAAMLGDFPFAHGGSGYLVSQASMRALFENKTAVGRQWDREAAGTCCGDYVFARAMKNATDVSVTNVWPTINGEKPHTLAYGMAQWCHPITTMHHVGSQEVSDMFAFERELSFQSIVRIKDIYHHFFEPNLVHLREDWDNLSDDDYYLDLRASHEDWEVDRAKKEGLSLLEKSAHLSAESCRRLCLDSIECFQWRYHRGICVTSRSFKHGKPTKVEGETSDKWMSGWDVQKIKEWALANDDCGDYVWPQV